MKGIIGIMVVMILSVGIVTASDGNMDGTDHTMHHDFESGREFGQHVSMHAKTMGFDGDHNPGVHHRGFSPWAR